MNPTTPASTPNAQSIPAGHAEHYDPVIGRMGMWLFLFTEVLLFGALFIVYAVYLGMHRWEFQEASRHLDKLSGAGNTVILLTSSLTLALAIGAFARGKRGLSLGMLAGTLALAALFLIVKSFEWGAKFAHDLYPNSATMHELPPGEQVFYGLYFTMTGLHALHVIVGGVAITVVMWLIWTRKIRPDRLGVFENVGLFWHLVDLVWIFLFPLFYLIG